MMMKLFDFLYIVRPDAATQQEWGRPLVCRQDGPVELLTVASYDFPFRVEQEVVGNTFIGLGG